MSSRKAGLAEPVRKEQECKHNANFDVDYVIIYRYDEPSIPSSSTEENFTKLIHNLAHAGLYTTVRSGANSTVLVFVRANKRRLIEEVYYARVKDWLYGIFPTNGKSEKKSLEAISTSPLTEAEKLRNVYDLIVNAPADGGAGITPKRREWKTVESIFPLHDGHFNDLWVADWKGKWVLSLEDLAAIKDHFGHKIAYYFAFLQNYTIFLVLPAALGALAWAFLGNFSPTYTVSNCLGCGFFVEYCTHYEFDLAMKWGVSGVGAIRSKGLDFRPDEVSQGPVTSETLTERLFWYLRRLPVAVFAVVMVGALIAFSFAVEILVEQVYDGPMKNALVCLPMVIITISMPLLQGPISRIARSLTRAGNNGSERADETSHVQTAFLRDFLTTFLPILLIAFVYVPFSSVIVPYLDLLTPINHLARHFGLVEISRSSIVQDFNISADRIKFQIIWFITSDQVIKLANTVFFKGSKKNESRGRKKSGQSVDFCSNDCFEEAFFLARVRKEAELEDYDTSRNLQEISKQFGYLSLFSCAWPLAALVFLIGNWLSLRSGAHKLCYQVKRPIPWRVDSVGPRREQLFDIAWFGSIISAILVYLLNDANFTAGKGIQIKDLVLTIILTDHLYLITQYLIRTLLGKSDSPNVQKDWAEKHLLRKRLLEESFGRGSAVDKAIKKMENDLGLQKEAESFVAEVGLQERFWAGQRTVRDTVKLGREIIEKGRKKSQGRKIASAPDKTPRKIPAPMNCTWTGRKYLPQDANGSRSPVKTC